MVLTNAQNLLKSSFQYTCDEIKSNIESHPQQSTHAINKLSKQKLNTLLDVVVSSIGDLDENRLYNVGAGFVSSFTACYRRAQYLFVLKIEESLCVLEIYSESVYINKITGSDPDEVWNQVKILKKYTGSYLFGITNTLVQEHLNAANNKSPTSLDPTTDKELLENLYRNNILQLNNNISLPVKVEDSRINLALKGNQKLGNSDSGTRIKKNIKAMLERFFLSDNRRNQKKIDAQAMHKKLLKYAETGDIEKKDTPQIPTIRSWISSYSSALKQ
ncbi:12770_t:CDS:2, partial [Gigaspora margarita]